MVSIASLLAAVDASQLVPRIAHAREPLPNPPAHDQPATVHVPFPDRSTDHVVALPDGGFAVVARAYGTREPASNRPSTSVVVISPSGQFVRDIALDTRGSGRPSVLVLLPGSSIVAVLMDDHVGATRVCWYELVDTTGKSLGALRTSGVDDVPNARRFSRVPYEVKWLAQGTRLVEFYRATWLHRLLRAQDPTTGKVAWSLDGVAAPAVSQSGDAIAAVRLGDSSHALLVVAASDGKETHRVPLPADLHRVRNVEWIDADRTVEITEGFASTDRRFQIRLADANVSTELARNKGPASHQIRIPRSEVRLTRGENKTWQIRNPDGTARIVTNVDRLSRCGLRATACDRLADGRLAVTSSSRGVRIYDLGLAPPVAPPMPAIDIGALEKRAHADRAELKAEVEKHKRALKDRDRIAKERVAKAERERLDRRVDLILRGRPPFAVFHRAISSLPRNVALKPLIAPYVETVRRALRIPRRAKEALRQARDLLKALAEHTELRTEAVKGLRRIAAALRPKPKPARRPAVPRSPAELQGQQGKAP
ncbi:MAG: hypothetical protein HYY84_05345 [Deltaproteobacteria bacterium]|nr:hypothetical protein [Deltaproteobacteria bacterium]